MMYTVTNTYVELEYHDDHHDDFLCLLVLLQPAGASDWQMRSLAGRRGPWLPGSLQTCQ